MKEAKVKSYTRKTKSGKTIKVKAYSRKCEGRSCADKKGSGGEYAKKNRKDSLPDIKHNPEFDNDEPSKKPRRNPRSRVPKWMEKVNKMTRQ